MKVSTTPSPKKTPEKNLQSIFKDATERTETLVRSYNGSGRSSQGARNQQVHLALRVPSDGAASQHGHKIKCQWQISQTVNVKKD